MSVQAGYNRRTPFQIDETKLTGNLALDLVAAEDGFVEELQIIVDKTITTGGTVKVLIGASTEVEGLIITVANGATKGTVQSDTPTARTPTAAFKKGDRIRISLASFATAGSITGNLLYNTGNRAAL